MPTTKIRLADELKARVATATERAGTSPHGFILEAIAAKPEKAEQGATSRRSRSAATRTHRQRPKRPVE